MRSPAITAFLFVMMLASVFVVLADCALHHPVDVPPDYPPLERELDGAVDGRP